MGAAVLVIIVFWVIFGIAGGSIDTHPEFQGQECWWDGNAWTSKRRWQT
jgi:hypothetical protein